MNKLYWKFVREECLIALVRHYLGSFNGTLKPEDGLDDYQTGAAAKFPTKGGNSIFKGDPINDRIRESAGDNRRFPHGSENKYSKRLIINGKVVRTVIHYPDGSTSKRKRSVPTEFGISHAIEVLKERGEKL